MSETLNSSLHSKAVELIHTLKVERTHVSDHWAVVTWLHLNEWVRNEVGQSKCPHFTVHTHNVWQSTVRSKKWKQEKPICCPNWAAKWAITAVITDHWSLQWDTTKTGENPMVLTSLSLGTLVLDKGCARVVHQDKYCAQGRSELTEHKRREERVAYVDLKAIALRRRVPEAEVFFFQSLQVRTRKKIRSSPTRQVSELVARFPLFPFESSRSPQTSRESDPKYPLHHSNKPPNGVRPNTIQTKRQNWSRRRRRKISSKGNHDK